MSRDLRDVLAPDHRVDELVRVALTTDERLDDITRAKIWTRLEDRIDDPRAARWRWPLAGLLAAAAIVAVVFGTRRGVEPAAFVTPPDTTLSLKLGPHARASLVGPARLEVIGALGDSTTVALRSGTLLAEFEGGPGRSLRIEAPGATIEIVGTLFSVEVHDRVTCVSVAHGRVRMTTFARIIEIGGGEAACNDEVQRHPVPLEIREALARHAAVLAAQAAMPSGVALPSTTHPDTTTTPPSAATTSTASLARTSTTSPATTSLATKSAATNAPATNAPATNARVPSSSSMPTASATSRHSPTSASASESASESASGAGSVSGAGSASGAGPGPSAGADVGADAGSIATTASSSAIGSDPPPTTSPGPSKPAATPTDSALYREAEAAIAKRDLAAADRILAKLVDALPASPLLDQALYERARIAYQRHAWSEARHHLDHLATLTSPLVEPGAYLACKVAVAANDAGADACLNTYRASYPHSPHDLDVLAVLADRAYRAGGCARAATLVDELARLYQATTAAHDWKARCP